MMCLKKLKIALNSTTTTTTAVILLLTGCATFEGAENRQNLSKLKYGMSEPSVLSLLGTPDTVSRAGNEDKWVYEFKKEQKQGQNIFVLFKNGEVAETGQLEGREIAAEKENSTSGSCTKRQHPEIMQESLCIR